MPDLGKVAYEAHSKAVDADAKWEDLDGEEQAVWTDVAAAVIEADDDDEDGDEAAEEGGDEKEAA